MKVLLVVSVFSFFLIVPAFAEMKTNRQKDGLAGPAQTVRIEAARFSNQSGKWVKGPRELVAVLAYDERGNRREVVPGHTDIVAHFEDIPHGKAIYTYDAQGRLTETVIYHPDGTISNKLLHTYDAQGHRTETTSYSSDGSINGKTAYTYDAQGHLTGEDSSNIFGFVTYTYDAQGNLIEEASDKSRAVHTYDVQGHRIETAYYDLAHDAGLGIDRTIVTYGVRGNMIERFTCAINSPCSASGSKTVYSYKFDSYGNWGERAETYCIPKAISGTLVCEPTIETYRTITYYPKLGDTRP